MTEEGCTTMRFDEFAERVNETVMPAESDLDRYIGPEHMDTMDLTIRRWDEGRNLESKKLVVRKGNIIIAKRRWYLRRVGIAPFDSLCSAHTLIVRPKNSNAVDPEFLPYFLLSDVFYDKAISISVGSLSPTINWSDLRSLKFNLPPITEQSKIVPFLKQIKAAESNLFSSLESINIVIKKTLESYLFDENNLLKNQKPIEDLGKVITGSTPNTKNSELYDGDILFVKPPDFNNSGVYITQTSTSLTSIGLDVCRKIPKDAVMFTCIGTIGKVALTSEECATNQQINSIICKDGVMPLYLYYVLSYLSTNIQRIASTSVVPIINKSTFSKIKVPLLEQNVQVEVIERIKTLEQIKLVLESLISKHKLIEKSLIYSLMEAL